MFMSIFNIESLILSGLIFWLTADQLIFLKTRPLINIRAPNLHSWGFHNVCLNNSIGNVVSSSYYGFLLKRSVRCSDCQNTSKRVTKKDAKTRQRWRTSRQIEWKRIKATEVGLWWQEALMYLTRWAIKPLHPASLSKRIVERTLLSCSLKCWKSENL